MEEYPIQPGGGGATTPVTITDETGSIAGSRQLVSGTNTTVDTGTPGQIKINATGGGGGGGGPFASAGFAPVTAFDGWSELVVSPLGDSIYVAGNLGLNAAFAKVSVSDGTVTATLDLGLSSDSPVNVAISSDGAYLYAVNAVDGATWWKIATSDMSITHTSTLAVPSKTSGQPFDLSPDGSSYVYTSGVDQKIYVIDTNVYTVTSYDVGQSSGGANVSAVCFYSAANFVVAYDGIGIVDRYSAVGAYIASNDTGSGGTPQFNAMRSAANNNPQNLFIADIGNSQIIVINNGTAYNQFLSSPPRSLSTNNLSPEAITGSEDICAFTLDSSPPPYICDAVGRIVQITAPTYLISDWAGLGCIGTAFMPDESGRIFTLSGENYPIVFSLSGIPVGPIPGAAGNLLSSDGLGNWVSQVSPALLTDGSNSMNASLPMNSNRIVSMSDPIDPQDASTKAYTDSLTSPIKVIEGAITSSQLKNLQSAPVTLLSGGGINTILSVTWHFHYVAPAYTAGSDLGITLTSGLLELSNLIIPSGTLKLTNSTWGIFYPTGALSETSGIAPFTTNWQLNTTGANFATGNGTLSYSITYYSTSV